MTHPLERYLVFCHWVCFGSSDPKTGLNDPIPCIMIVSWCLNTFLAILDFFNSYHTLVILCKLQNLGFLAFLAIFDEIAKFQRHFGNFKSVQRGERKRWYGGMQESRNFKIGQNVLKQP